MPFSQLIERDERLAEIRRSYADRTAEERRRAADWAYHASSAADTFNRAPVRVGQAVPFSDDWPPGFEALAIDPLYAPALLTVGSIECQLGRLEEALSLFENLLRLPKETPDLEEILDKAAMCLMDESLHREARGFLEKACSTFPESTVVLSGLGFCCAKLGRLDEAVELQRRAVELAPEDPKLLSDYGWALAECQHYEEAERILRRAVDLAPPEYDRPLHNLEEVRRRRSRTSA